jgi:hypothetical protein
VTSAGETPVVLRHGPWRRRKRLALLLRCGVLLGLVAVVIVGVLAGLAWYKRAVLGLSVDSLWEKVLAEGNAEAAWRRADPRFQALYPREVFLQHARRHPALFDRGKLAGAEVVWLTKSGDLVVVVKARVDEGSGPEEVSYYCSRSEWSGFRLLGIEPGLKAAVPAGLEPFPRPGRDRSRN